MTKFEAIKDSEQFTKDAALLLSKMNDFKRSLTSNPDSDFDDRSEVIAQHILSIRALEECMLRQSLVQEYIGIPF